MTLRYAALAALTLVLLTGCATTELQKRVKADYPEKCAVLKVDAPDADMDDTYAYLRSANLYVTEYNQYSGRVDAYLDLQSSSLVRARHASDGIYVKTMGANGRGMPYSNFRMGIPMFTYTHQVANGLAQINSAPSPTCHRVL